MTITIWIGITVDKLDNHEMSNLTYGMIEEDKITRFNIADMNIESIQLIINQADRIKQLAEMQETKLFKNGVIGLP